MTLWVVIVRVCFLKRQNFTETVRTVHVPGDRILDKWNGLWSIPILVYLFTGWLDRFQLPFPDWLRWAGGIIFLTGDVLFYWSHHSLGKNWAPHIEIRAKHKLVVNGAYKWIRHPMYLSFILIGIGELVVSANWLVGLVLVPIILSYIIRVRPEEQMMLEEFGDEYREYIDKTGRLLTKLPKE